MCIYIYIYIYYSSYFHYFNRINTHNWHHFRTEKPSEEPTTQTPGAEEIDIDLNDPDVEAAAVKIQASFKGYQTRKSAKSVCERILTQMCDTISLYTSLVY